MADVLTVVAKLRAAASCFYEQYRDEAAFEAHRKAPHLTAFRERREREGLIEGATEVEIYRALTE